MLYESSTYLNNFNFENDPVFKYWYIKTKTQNKVLQIDILLEEWTKRPELAALEVKIK